MIVAGQRQPILIATRPEKDAFITELKALIEKLEGHRAHACMACA